MFRQNGNINYNGNTAPLKQNSYIRLPLGAIKPEGWLKSQLQAQAEGLTVTLMTSGPTWSIPHGEAAAEKHGKEVLITLTVWFLWLISLMMKSL